MTVSKLVLEFVGGNNNKASLIIKEINVAYFCRLHRSGITCWDFKGSSFAVLSRVWFSLV